MSKKFIDLNNGVVWALKWFSDIVRNACSEIDGHSYLLTQYYCQPSSMPYLYGNLLYPPQIWKILHFCFHGQA